LSATSPLERTLSLKGRFTPFLPGVHATPGVCLLIPSYCQVFHCGAALFIPSFCSPFPLAPLVDWDARHTTLPFRRDPPPFSRGGSAPLFSPVPPPLLPWSMFLRRSSIRTSGAHGLGLSLVPSLEALLREISSPIPPSGAVTPSIIEGPPHSDDRPSLLI